MREDEAGGGSAMPKESGPLEQSGQVGADATRTERRPAKLEQLRRFLVRKFTVLAACVVFGAIYGAAFGAIYGPVFWMGTGAEPLSTTVSDGALYGAVAGAVGGGIAGILGNIIGGPVGWCLAGVLASIAMAVFMAFGTALAASFVIETQTRQRMLLQGAGAALGALLIGSILAFTLGCRLRGGRFTLPGVARLAAIINNASCPTGE